MSTPSKNLYENDNIADENAINYLSNINDLKFLKGEEAQQLEGNISEAECFSAIKCMKLSKSPGSDGIPVEFYITFRHSIKSLFSDSINEAYETGELTTTEKKVSFNLIFKKNDKSLLTN